MFELVGSDGSVGVGSLMVITCYLFLVYVVYVCVEASCYIYTFP